MIDSRNIKQVYQIITLICLIPTAVLAQKSDFNNLIFAVGAQETEGILIGNTGGAYSLSSISNQDRDGNLCMGYGDPQPDHILTLKSDIPRLTVQLEGAGGDTTLVIKNLESDAISCAYSQDSSGKIEMEARNWSAGIYHIWVGSIYPHQRSPYRLSVRG